jgi:hypothetical protein
MDILTPKGQKTREQEREALTLFLETFPRYSFVETPKDKPSDLDGFVTRDGVIISGVEVKCRNMTASELRNKFDNRWLITADKLDRCVNICRSLCVDFRGFLYLVPDKMLIVVPIFSHDKGWLTEPIYDWTETQATVNGGIAERLNAYVDVGHATSIVAAA